MKSLRFARWIVLLLIGVGVLWTNSAYGVDGQKKDAPKKSAPPLLLGTAWYPESWPESRWEADLALMQAAHIHFVRVGEFAWSKMERTEGVYDFDWLERAIDLAAKHDIYIVLGTPTAAPPAWLTHKYPETLRTEDNGRKDVHGGRLQYNWDDPKYRELCRDIAERMAKRFGHNPNVLGWQIDNEYSSVSFDDATRRDFQQWLRGKYGTLENLNNRWATDYWSQYYTDWSEIPIPDHDGHEGGNPGLLLNWRMFVSETFRSYQKVQVDVIRANSDSRQFITTNTMGWFDLYDHYTTAQDLDMSAWDDYFGNGKADLAWSGSTHDLTRGFKQKNFWVMETQPGFVNWSNENVSLPAGVVRALAWHDVAHGADAVSYWQWRSALNGQEQYHGTLLGADGTPVPLYQEVQQEGAEFERAGAVMKDTHPESEVAILESYPSRWAIQWQRHTDKYDPIGELISYYRPLRNVTQGIDILPPSASLAKYKLVVAPALNVITPKEAENLIAYVKGGGNLVLGARSGMKDEDNALQPQRQPGPLADLLGGRVEQYYVIVDPVPLTGEIAVKEGTTWAELLSTSSPDTKVVLRYGKANGWLDGKPAMITRQVGKGSITYVGTCLGWSDMPVLVQWMQKQFGLVTPLPGVPNGVEASRRYGADHTVTFLVNFSDKDQDIALPSAMDDVLQGGSVKQVHLPVYGVAVLDQRK